MAVLRDTFIRKYTQAIREGNAGIFAGAGLSRASGYVDWKNLLRPLAKEVELDIEKEKDLLSVAQYYRNESGTRGGINQEILNAFNAEVSENENVEIISRLPISTYWTSNSHCKRTAYGIIRCKERGGTKWHIRHLFLISTANQGD